jgi:protein SCO1/2
MSYQFKANPRDTLQSMAALFRTIRTGICVSLVISSAAMGDTPASMNAHAAGDPRAPRPAATSRDIQRSEATYAIPAVDLVRDDGKTVSLPAELDDGRPVVLNFIYTSCSTICPLSSQVFAQFQRALGTKHESTHLVSISTDPEQDSPARLHAYAQQFHAQRGWDQYTGTMAASVAVQRAFGAYYGDKMSHSPLTLMRAAPGKPWVRLDGFATGRDLLAERKLWRDAPGLARAVQ